MCCLLALGFDHKSYHISLHIYHFAYCRQAPVRTCETSHASSAVSSSRAAARSARCGSAICLCRRSSRATTFPTGALLLQLQLRVQTDLILFTLLLFSNPFCHLFPSAVPKSHLRLIRIMFLTVCIGDLFSLCSPTLTALPFNEEMHSKFELFANRYFY